MVLGHVTDTEGKKESKSKGNYTPPEVIFDRIAQEFAVIEGETAGFGVKPGEALIAREDLEALGMLPGAEMQMRGPDRAGQALTVKLRQAKKLSRAPRRRYPRPIGKHSAFQPAAKGLETPPKQRAISP